MERICVFAYRRVDITVEVYDQAVCCSNTLGKSHGYVEAYIKDDFTRDEKGCQVLYVPRCINLRVHNLNNIASIESPSEKFQKFIKIHTKCRQFSLWGR